jgi:cell division protein FtsW (lipid II flippase)
MTLSKWILDSNWRSPEIRSFRNLQRALGILGMLLPPACVLGGLLITGTPVQNSVSHYYHTSMGDALVGLLACAAIFLMTYAGYSPVDNAITWLAGIAALGIVVFPSPTYPQEDSARIGLFNLTQKVTGPIHLGFSAAFFILLAVISIFLFTLSDKKSPGDRKLRRNRIYLWSGIAILASLAALLVMWLAARHFFENSSIALVFEWVMLWAFGVAWIVKGGFPGLADAPKAARSKPRQK